MLKKTLLLGAASMVFAVPAYAQEVTAGADLTATVNYANNIDTSIVTDVDFESDIRLRGDIDVEGDVDVDSAATAVSDVKQITNDLLVIFDERFDDGDGELTEEEIEALLTNGSNAGNVNGNGNVGVNSAAGYYNSQANVATIAVASGGENEAEDDSGGMAQANTTAAQSLTGTYYGPEFDDPGEQDPFEDNNTAVTGAVGGNGNIGVNSAAGAFNQQQNVMTIAVATDSALASASAGVVQFNNGNMVILNDSANGAFVGGVTGAGNIHVNVAAGVGNQQHNSLTVAASGAFGGNGTGGANGAGGGF